MRITFSKEEMTLALFGIIALPAFGQQSQQNKVKPNVLFIAIDDLKPFLSCYGDSLAKTPNIDRIASKGTLFSLAYCQQAVSGPTRASLLTGLRPDQTKVWDLVTVIRDINPDVITLPQNFRMNGYETAGIGKIFHPGQVDKNEDERSWSVPYMNYNDYYDPTILPPAGFRNEFQSPIIRKAQIEKGNDYVEKNMFFSSECQDVSDMAYKDGATAEGAVQFIMNYDSKKPFFLGYGCHKPHLPFVSPKKYWDLYKREDMPLAKFKRKAEGSPDFAYTNIGEFFRYSDVPPLCTLSDIENIVMPDEKAAELLHAYYACVSYVDAQIGRVLDALEKKGISDNTIIVLWGDHGWHFGDHGLWCKHTNFEQATHAPLLIYSPRIAPSKVNSPVEFIDIYPTLCDLSGISKPDGLAGQSLVKVMKNPGQATKKYAISQYPRGDRMGYSMRDKRYRYTIWLEWKNKKTNVDNMIAEELYDYKKDPLESVNLVDKKDYQRVAKKMKDEMYDFLKSEYTK